MGDQSRRTPAPPSAGFDPPDWATDAFLRTIDFQAKMAARKAGKPGAIPQRWCMVDAVLYWWETGARDRWLSERVAQPESGEIPRNSNGLGTQYSPVSGAIPPSEPSSVREVWNLYDSASSWADFEAIHARVAAQFGAAPQSEEDRT